MASYHRHMISDSEDSDSTIDPNEESQDKVKILASDSDPDSPVKPSPPTSSCKKQVKTTPNKKIPLVHSKSLHEISDSDSGEDPDVIPPTQQTSRHTAAKPKPRQPTLNSSISKSSEQTPELNSKSKIKIVKKESKRSPLNDERPTTSKLKRTPTKHAASLHELSDSDNDSDKKAVDAELADMTSPVRGATLGRKLNKDPTVVQQWASKGQSLKRSRDEGDDPRPLCKDGRMCLRKSQAHFEQFRHPEAVKHKDEWPVEKKRRVRSPVDNNSSTYTPFSFFLSKVDGIDDKYNDMHSMDIKDILSPYMGQLQKSAQFSYVFDIPWLINQYPPCFRNLPLTVVHGFQRQEKKVLESDAKPYSNITLCRGKLEILYGTHHTKMMLLVYDNGMRVVVTTANLIEKDWAQKTQGLWMSPLYPKLPKESATEGDSPTRFKSDLLQYLSVYADPAMAEWVAAVRQHDMSATKVYMIASVPGRHTGSQRASFGHLKLQKILSEKGPTSEMVRGWPAVAQFSSVGSMGATSEVWLNAEFLSSLSATKGPRSSKPELKLVYPSKANVRESLEGYPAGASLPYSINTAKKQTWLHEFWHHWYSEVRGRSPASPHIKTYLRADKGWRNLAWFLVTSANLSKAAWGALEKSGSQLMIRSYEMGVLFLPQSFGLETFEALRTDTENPSADHVFPVPYDLPPTRYDIKVDRPWVWDIPYVDKPDRHGNKWCPT